MAKYLDYNGLNTVWNKIKQTFATQVALNNAVNDINTLQTNYNTITANLTPALVNQYLLNVKDMLADNIKPSDINSVAKWFKTYDVKNLDIDTLQANSAYISELKADEITSGVIKSTAAYVNYLTTNAIKASDIVTAHAQIQNLDATYAKVQDLTAATARIGNLETDNATINGTLTAQAADITTLKADSARIDSIEADNITIKDSFTAINGKIDTLEADNVTINETLTANKATIDDLTANKASISDLEAVTGRITTLESDNVTINDTLNAQNADITNLKADKADITDLTAATGRIDTLESDNVTINETLTANKASIDDLTVNKASIEDLNATNANVTNLTTDMANVDKLLTAHSAVIDNLDTNFLHADAANITNAGIENLKSNLITANNIVTATLSASQAQVGDLQALLIKSDKIAASLADLTEADIKVLFADNAFVQNLQSVSSTTAKSVIDSAYISDIVANNISVADLKAGDITLSDSMRILSENGAMLMNGTVLQISGKDKNGDTYVGVQLGYDAKNEPSLILKNSAGATVLTPSGITKDAVADGLIVNDMIGDSTIQKEKLGFQIVDTDENGNISITNVLDGSGNNFGVEYTNFVKNTNDSLSTLTSSISGVETKVNNTDKKITDKVWQTDIKTAIDDYNKDTVTGIASRVTATETDLNGIHTTISDIQTDVSKKADSSDVTTLTERIATAESDVSGFKTTVQQTYATKDENTASLESAKAYAEAQVDGIVIGGRNLILNSDFHNGFTNWTTGSNAVSYTIKTDSEYGTYLAFACNGTGNTSANRVYQGVFDGGGNHVAGATYTLSFDAKLSRDGYFNAGWGSGVHQFSGTTAWQHFEHTYTVTGTGSFTMFPNAAGTTLSITHIMLERSTKASNWVLALGDQDAAISSVRTYAEQLADRFYWVVESNSSKTSLTMTDAMLEAITTQFVVKDPSGTATVISGGNIQTNSITANMLATDAIKSNNYKASSNTDSHYSALGTYLDLSNGNFYTQNFGVDNINGKAYLNGEIIATSGRIGSNALTNYWELGTKTDYNGRASAALIGHGTSYIQSGGWQISNNRINTQSYDIDNNITYLYDGNTYYDFGMKVPEVNKNASGYINGISNNWLYIRKHANTIPTLEEEWNYIFRVDETGMIYINGKSLDQMYASIDSATSAYLPTSGGTINGDLIVTGTFTANVSEANKVSNRLTINGKEYDGSSPVDVGVIDIAHGGTGANSWIANRILFASDTTALSQLPAGESGQILMSNGTDAPSWINQSAITIDSATQATQDGNGDEIATTYLKKTGGTITGDLTVNGDLNISSLDIDAITVDNLTVTGTTSFTNAINGDLEGNVTGNLTGNVTGNVSGTAGSWATDATIIVGGSESKVINAGSTITISKEDISTIATSSDFGWMSSADKAKLDSINISDIDDVVTADTIVGQDGVSVVVSEGIATISGEFKVPTTAGTQGQIIVSNGTTGVWTNPTIDLFTSGSSSGVLPVDKGGTGQSTALDAINSFINALPAGNDVITDTDYFISQYADAESETITYNRKPVSFIWDYVGNKISSLLGLTSSGYSGQISKAGGNVNIVKGRDTALTKTTSFGGYSAIFSQKTTNGTWDFGTNINDAAYLTYVPDSRYEEDVDSGYTQIKFGKDSSITASIFIGSLTGTASGNLPLTGGTVTGTLILSKSTDASGVVNNFPALIVGGIDTQPHLEIDADEIMSKTNGTAVSTLFINKDGGLVSIGSGGLKIHNSIATSGSLNIGSNTNDDITFDSGVKLEYSSATKALNFVFA